VEKWDNSRSGIPAQTAFTVQGGGKRRGEGIEQCYVHLPKLSQPDRLKFTALPWCSRLKLFSDESSVAIVSGPAKIGREWFLPILGPKISKETDTLASLQKTAARLRRSGGYTPRS
jgi:hypothetical protein